MRAVSEGTGSRRGFLRWGMALGGVLAVGIAQVNARLRGHHQGHPSHAGVEPFELPPFHYGPRIGEPGYEVRVAALFQDRGLPTNPSSY